MNAGNGYAINIQREQRKNELYTLYTVQELVEHCLDEEIEIERLNNIIDKLKKNKKIKKHNNEKILPPPFEYRGCFTNKKIG